MGAAHEGSELFLGDFDQQLARFDRGEHIPAQGRFFYAVGKPFGYGVVNVGINEGAPDFLGGLCDIGFCDGGFSTKALKSPFKAVTEGIEHG
jgi:hypothetical protein